MPNITLTSLLEIGLDLSYETSDLPQLAALMQSKNIPCQLCTPQQENSGKVLVISCITGMGTAEKIKKVLEESFGELMSQDTRMVILDYNEVRSLSSQDCRIFRLSRSRSCSLSKAPSWYSAC